MKGGMSCPRGLFGGHWGVHGWFREPWPEWTQPREPLLGSEMRSGAAPVPRGAPGLSTPGEKLQRKMKCKNLGQSEGTFWVK